MFSDFTPFQAMALYLGFLILSIRFAFLSKDTLAFWFSHGLGAFAALVTMWKHDLDWQTTYSLSVLLFLLMSTFLNKDYLLPHIDTHVVVVSLLIGMYLAIVIAHYYQASTFVGIQYILGFFIVLAFISLVLTFFTQGAYLTKLMMYMMYLVCVLLVGIWLFPMLLYEDFISSESTYITQFLSGVMLAAAIYHVSAQFVFLLHLTPLPGKNQTFSQRLKDLREYADDLVQRVDLVLPSPLHYCMYLCFALFLAMNVRTQFVQPWVIITTLVSIEMLLSMKASKN